MLKQALNEWRAWPLEYCRQADATAPTFIQIFNEGLSHHAALIELDDQQYVLKVFEHSADHAIQAQAWAIKLGLAPTILFAQDSIMLMEYVNDKSCDIQSIAQSLKTLHHAEVPDSLKERFNVISFCEQYLESVDQRFVDMHAQLKPAVEHFVNDSTPWCVCHNDLVVANCLTKNQRNIFIDWEYAQYHNPWFDLAAIIYYFDLSNEQATEFLEQYQTGWSEYQSKAIYFSAQIALLWGDILWHLSQFGMDYLPKLRNKLQDIRQLNQVFRQFS